MLLVSKAGGRYVALDVPQVGAGGFAEFDTHVKAGPVILVEDNCCEQHHVLVAKRKGDALVEFLRAEALDPDRVDVLRDGDGRILTLKVSKG